MESGPARIYGVEKHLDDSSHYSRRRLIEQATLSREDLHEIARCRRNHSCLGFAYQIGFVYLENRFPIQRPFEVMDNLLQFISVQVGIEPDGIHEYASHQQTISQHQIRIR